MIGLAQRFAQVQQNINLAAKRNRGQSVKLVAVTKTVPQDIIAEALALGFCVFGENRVQEALHKITLFPQAEWHLIGQLQTNKVKDVVGTFSLIHSLDRFKLATALQAEAEKRDVVVRALLQINIGGEAQKGGLEPDQAADFLRVAAQLTHLCVEGLMAVPPQHEDPEHSRPYFREMYQLFSTLKQQCKELTTLSMGMSNDYVVAVEEGATLVRIGSLLFGERN